MCRAIKFDKKGIFYVRAQVSRCVCVLSTWSESGLRITADLEVRYWNFLPVAGGRLGCNGAVGKRKGRGSRAFAYIDFTSRDEWHGGEA